MDRKLPVKHGLAEAVPTVGRLVPLTLYYDSSFSGYINDTVYVPPLPGTLPALAGKM